MAKNIDKDKLTLKPRKNVTKTPPVSENGIEKIHPTEDKERKRITLDLPKAIYKQVKMKLVERDETLIDYFVALVKKDLNLD